MNEAFLATHPHPILRDGVMSSSLVTVLTAVGVADVVLDFPDFDPLERARFGDQLAEPPQVD